MERHHQLLPNQALGAEAAAQMLGLTLPQLARLRKNPQFPRVRTDALDNAYWLEAEVVAFKPLLEAARKNGWILADHELEGVDWRRLAGTAPGPFYRPHALWPMLSEG